MRPRIPTVLLVVLGLFAFVVAVSLFSGPGDEAGDAPGEPYSLSEVKRLVGSGVAPARIGELVGGACLGFRLDSAAARGLRAAGAGDAHLRRLESACVEAPRPERGGGGGTAPEEPPPGDAGEPDRGRRAAALRCAASAEGDSLVYAERRSVPVGRAPAAVAAADFDGDGADDLVTANRGSDDVSLLRGADSAGGWPAERSRHPVGEEPADVVTGRFDGDDLPDVAVVHGGSKEISVLAVSSGPGFRPAEGSPVPTETEWTAAAALHADGDGSLDLAGVSPATASVRLILARGDGGFGGADRRTVGIEDGRPVSIVAGRAGRDGVADLVIGIGAGAAGRVAYRRGRGGGEYPAGSRDHALMDAPVDLAGGDFNGDGLRDVAVALDTGDERSAAGRVTVLLGRGFGLFVEPDAAPFEVGRRPVELVAGDLDGDGGPDLAVLSSADARLEVLAGAGDGTFRGSGAGPLDVGGAPAGLACGDFDANGVPDLAVAGRAAGDVTVLFGFLR